MVIYFKVNLLAINLVDNYLLMPPINYINFTSVLFFTINHAI